MSNLAALFPLHRCGMYLTHNEHRDVNQSIEEWEDEYDAKGDWVSEYERAKAHETNEVWVLTWYPETPVAFYRVVGSTLESVLEASTYGRS